MLKPFMFLVSFVAFSMEASAAGNCVCTTGYGSGKRACIANISACQQYCNPMYFSFGGSCDTTPQPPALPVGQFRVDALTGSGLWTDTGIEVQAGETYRVTAIAVDSWQTNPYWIIGGAAGHPSYRGGPNYLLPGAPEGALIGRIGDGPAFLIGNSGITPAGLTGRLFLGPNDEMHGRFDNRGNLTVEVKIN